jgi:hypothetical protein
VPDERITHSYAMHLDETRISVSPATLAYKAENAGTRLNCTEHGTTALFDALGAEPRREPAKG